MKAQAPQEDKPFDVNDPVAFPVTLPLRGALHFSPHLLVRL